MTDNDRAVLAIETGGTKLQAALGTSGGRIVRKARCRVPEGATGAEMECLLNGLCDPLVREAKPSRVGIGFGGPVDNEAGKSVLSHHNSGWEGFPLRDWAQQRFGVSCKVENDANAAALAEATVGAGAGVRVMVYTNVGSGIGGGLVIDGRLYNGRYGACEIGHTKLYDPRQGRYVITEELCSGWAINRLAREAAQAGGLSAVRKLADSVEAITAEHVGQAANAGDAEAGALVAAAAGQFAIALCNVITLLNPDRVVVGGGVALMGEAYLAPLRTAVAKNVFDLYAHNFQIVPAKLGEDAVLVGALLI